MEFTWARGDVILGDGNEVARANRSWWGERADLQIGAESWLFHASGSWWGQRLLVAERDGVEWYRATPSGVFSRTWTIDAGPYHLQMSRPHLFTSRLDIVRAGAPIGSVRKSGVFSTRPLLAMAEPIDPRVGCFLLWVAFIEFARSQRQAGAGAAT